ncbi:MAG: hypothetical protein LBT74_10820 [Acidobacteriota bacterium]|jgi:hypothetical protein|nr:hypothetical protein [Acidobacteriota bacterium]
MLDWILFAVLAASGAAIVHNAAKKKLQRRIEALERDLELYTDVVSKMAQVQAKTFEKFSVQFDELEGRILDLGVPSPIPDMPLEKRHQVLSLARQGVALEDIVKRVKAPVGEAELLLNLRKYRSGVPGGAYAAEAVAPPA